MSSFYLNTKLLLCNRDKNKKPWFSYAYETHGRIKLGVKPGTRITVDDFLSNKFKEDKNIIDIEETVVTPLGNDVWKLEKGSQIKPFQFINVCKDPLHKIEEICAENSNNGTLGCFAKDEMKNKYYAITAQHVLSDQPDETDKERYIFSRVSKGNGQNMQYQTAMLSTQSSGLQKVGCFGQNDYFLDIAMMPLSKSLNNVGTVACTEEFAMAADVEEGDEVFKIGKMTGETIGTFVGPIWDSHTISDDKGWGFLVKSADKDSPFAEKGDSGSLVFLKKNQQKYALGILIQLHQNPSGDADDKGYFCMYMWHGKTALEKQFRVNLKLYGGLSFEKSPGKTFFSHDDIEKTHCRCNKKRPHSIG